MSHDTTSICKSRPIYDNLEHFSVTNLLYLGTEIHQTQHPADLPNLRPISQYTKLFFCERAMLFSECADCIQIPRKSKKEIALFIIIHTRE